MITAEELRDAFKRYYSDAVFLEEQKWSCEKCKQEFDTNIKMSFYYMRVIDDELGMFCTQCYKNWIASKYEAQVRLEKIKELR